MNHKELDVWKESINLVTKVYSLTENFQMIKNLISLHK